MSDHAFLSPSASNRWLVCHASPHREALEPDTTTDAARLGTAAHELFEKAMEPYVHQLTPYLGFQASNGVEFSKEMIENILNTRRAITRAYSGAKWLVEKRVPIWKAFSLPTPELWGTADLIGSHDHRLIVADLKYGMHCVSPEANTQLILYAIGAMHQCRWKFPEIDLVILQPRAGKLFKRCTYTRDELMAWKDELTPKIQNVLNSTVETVAVPGNHCYFCKAWKSCSEKAMSVLEKDFAEFL